MENEIVIIVLPSHTTQFLQPLDRSFFRPLKVHYYENVRVWLRNKPGRKIDRLVFGEIFGRAWGKAATVINACSGFQACGVFPVDRAALPEEAFRIADTANSTSSSFVTQAATSTSNPATAHSYSPAQQKGRHRPSHSSSTTPAIVTFEDLSPAPTLESQKTHTRGRKRQMAAIVTSEEHRKSAVERSLRSKARTCTKTKQPIVSHTSQGTTLFVDPDAGPSVTTSLDNDPANYCGVCNAYFYSDDTRKRKWIECQTCRTWFHVSCAGAQGCTYFTCDLCD